jgi:hypothetical protein
MAQAQSYSQYRLALDADFVGRVATIMKDEGYAPAGVDSLALAQKYAGDVAAQPGLAEAYHAALLNNRDDAGRADDVITDGQLLSAVAAVAALVDELPGI